MDSKRDVIVKRGAKDSVFVHLFQDKKYVLQLYKALHPEDVDATEDMIEIITLENVLTDNIYNDLGFMIDKRLIVLVEAQSTWTANIIVRALMYLAQTYHDYIAKEELNIYGSKTLDLPEPEMYVIYTGTRKSKKKRSHCPKNSSAEERPTLRSPSMFSRTAKNTISFINMSRSQKFLTIRSNFTEEREKRLLKRFGFARTEIC